MIKLDNTGFKLEKVVVQFWFDYRVKYVQIFGLYYTSKKIDNTWRICYKFKTIKLMLKQYQYDATSGLSNQSIYNPTCSVILYFDFMNLMIYSIVLNSDASYKRTRKHFKQLQVKNFTSLSSLGMSLAFLSMIDAQSCDEACK